VNVSHCLLLIHDSGDSERSRGATFGGGYPRLFEEEFETGARILRMGPVLRFHALPSAHTPYLTCSRGLRACQERCFGGTIDSFTWELRGNSASLFGEKGYGLEGHPHPL